jgi:hypothetical protein
MAEAVPIFLLSRVGWKVGMKLTDEKVRETLGGLKIHGAYPCLAYAARDHPLFAGSGMSARRWTWAEQSTPKQTNG